VLGAEGQLGGYNGVGRQVRINPYNPTADADYPWLKDALANRPATALASDWLLIDLRRLRGLPSSDISPQWRQLSQGYDLVVIAPKLTPASLVGVNDPGS
jgi:hypothetical protein